MFYINAANVTYAVLLLLVVFLYIRHGGVTFIPHLLFTVIPANSY